MKSKTEILPRQSDDLRQSKWNTRTAAVCHYVTVLLVAFGVCFAHSLAFASSVWVSQTVTYNNYHPISGACHGTINSNLWSDDFGFTPTPGDCVVIINGAYFDDIGSIGGINVAWHGCGGLSSTLTNTVVPATNILINGNRLGVATSVTDACCGWIGWENVSITFWARCGSGPVVGPKPPSPGNNYGAPVSGSSGSGGGSGCNNCGGVGAPAFVENGCVHITMGLGKDTYGQNAGQLVIDTNYPSLALAKPDSIQAFLRPTVERIDVSGVLRQIRTSQLLADVAVSNNFCYAVKFYTASNFSPVKVGGFYQPTGQPFNVVTVQNPDVSTNTYNRLSVTATDDLGNHQTNVFTWVASAQTWELATGGGLRTETRSEIWDGTHTILTQTNEVVNADTTVAFKQIETSQVFPWGATNLIQQIVDPDGTRPLTNTWVYYTNSAADSNNYGHLKLTIAPSSYWERYQYDSLARMTNKVAQFGDAAVDAPESQCRVWKTTYNYDSFDDSFNLCMTNVEQLLGQEIGRSYRIDFPGGVTNIVCQTPGAAINASNNLVTVATSFTSGPFESYPAKTQNPDGTVSVYQYATNAAGKTTTVWSGVPDATGTNIVDGTKTVTVVDLGGNSVSNATYDVASGLLLSSAVTLQTDELGRPTLVQYNDGTTETSLYGCCGLESQTDRQGITTSYTYDDLRRVSTITRAGITTIYTYDASGRTLTTTRQGTDNSQILQNVSVYDTAGRLLASTNALNNGTSYSETLVNGDTVKTTTYPDGSTRIETYYQDGQLRNVTGTAVSSPARYEYGVEIPAGESVYRAYTREIKLNTDGSDTGEWTKTYTDMAGRAYKTVYAAATTNYPFSQSFYNNQGQLYKQVDPDSVATLYQYNAKGELAYTATDLNTNGVIDFTGMDRITFTTNDVVADHDTSVRHTRTFVWATNNVDASNLVSTVETSVDGLQSWNVTCANGNGLTNYSQTIYNPANASAVITAIAPDGSVTITTNQLGRLTSVTRKDASGTQIGQTIYGYDAHGRQSTVTDARNGTTTSYFNNADQLVATLTPSPDGVQAGQFTTNILDSMDRVIQTILPDNTSVTNVYYTNGLLQQTFGSRTYPVGYSYDYAGRMKTMTNWSNFSSLAGARVTTWNYDTYRGFLTNKAYADGNGPIYTYTAGGKMKTRTWARVITTTYNYDNSGMLSVVSYSDTTPGVTNAYDRRGRQVAITNGANVCLWTYNDANETLTESYTCGPLSGLAVTNGYDQYFRRTNLTVYQSNNPLVQQSFAFDSASRLSSVSTLDSGQGTLDSATYSYLANSPLVGQILFTNNGVRRMTTTKQYDCLNRLTQISSVGGASSASPISFNYNYNNANQRVRNNLADSSCWIYQYDALGQVTNGCKYFYDGTPVAGQQFGYLFDDIGNRRQTKTGGDASGSSLRLANYTNNLLNQITSRDVPPYVDVKGVSIATNTVTVNSQTAYRKWEYFRTELAPNNSSTALWTNIIVAATGQTSVTGNVFMAQTPETFSYDADGNLTNDGRWTYTWDAENRLINLTSLANAPAGSKLKLDFAYDAQGRRIQKIVSTNNGSIYVPQYTNRFVYDGWNLIAILNPQSSILASFTWGNDLSGSSQGAGGEGGLLEVSYHGASTTNCFAAYDGNGNVAVLVNTADGTTLAIYEYGPFGEVIRSTGPMAKANPFRFSTKYQDDESDLLYYGYRYYKPSTGTWPNRDPFLETAFAQLWNHDTSGVLFMVPDLNEYGFVNEDPIVQIDYIGGAICTCSFSPPKVGYDFSDDFTAPDGHFVCTSANQGATATRTDTTPNCLNGFVSSLLCYDCEKHNCTAKLTYKCGIGKGTTTAWKGKPVWQFQSYVITKACP